jgi:hypothetical protein
MSWICPSRLPNLHNQPQSSVELGEEIRMPFDTFVFVFFFGAKEGKLRCIPLDTFGPGCWAPAAIIAENSGARKVTNNCFKTILSETLKYPRKNCSSRRTSNRSTVALQAAVSPSLQRVNQEHVPHSSNSSNCINSVSKSGRLAAGGALLERIRFISVSVSLFFCKDYVQA